MKQYTFIYIGLCNVGNCISWFTDMHTIQKYSQNNFM